MGYIAVLAGECVIMIHVMWEHTYLKALRGVNWWPVAVIAAVMFVGLGFGSYFLEARLTKTSAPAVQRPVKPSALREEPEQIYVPVDSVETVTPVQQAPAVRTAPERRVANEVAATAPKPAEIVRQINEARRASGVPAVKEDALLDKSSTLKVSDMISRNYWDHHAPGESPWAAIRQVGYSYSYVGENLAYGNYGNLSPETTIVQNWLKSSGHRKNMLNPQYKDIGIAVQKAQSFNGNREVYVIVTQYATKR